ncbi:MAG: hypothetical protein GY909_04875 [Oligoflexia bacterium]|nr:hypothetical protein [Oligoflexia bacterium]
MNPLILSLIIILVCSFFSAGFLHPDEHYQILELINLKMGGYTDLSIFNWDFNLKIRSWFQPALYYFLLKPFSFLDPFSQAFLIRLFNGVLGIFAIKKCLDTFDLKEDIQKSLLYVILIWFVPFFLVRTSSESLSTSLFLFGSYFFLSEKEKVKGPFVSGLFFGLSFLARYQMGVAILFVNIWSLIKRRDIKSFLIHSFSVLLFIGVGLIIDSWGYGETVFTPYSYFRENILNSKASNFGTAPFWYYLLKGLLVGIPPISILLYFGLFKYYKKEKIDFYGYAFLSFLVIHSLIPHKEVRFLMFNYILAAIIFIVMRSELKINSKLIKFTLIVNFMILAKVMFTPISKEIKLYEEIYDQGIKRVQVLDKSLPKFEFTMPFYQKQKIETVISEGIVEQFVLSTKYHQFKEREDSLARCELLHSSYPSWIIHFNAFKWLDRSAYFMLFHCQ